MQKAQESVTQNTKPLSIVLLNFDWRDIFTQDKKLFLDKLRRDHLNPDTNSFFIISWSKVGYVQDLSPEYPHIRSLHRHWRGPVLRPLLDLYSLFTLPFILRKHNVSPDIILCYDFPSVFTAWIAKKITQAKIVLCLTHLPRESLKTRSLASIKMFYAIVMEKITKSSIDYLYAISATIKSYGLQIGIREDKISVFSSDVISRDELFIRKAQAGIIRKKYTIAQNTPIILSIGRLESEKGQDRVLNAFTKLHSSAVLMFVGEGIYKSELQALAKQLEVDDRVIFAGTVSREEIWNYFKDATVFYASFKS
jgi:glycosyltransferase involved in cell wall biosynthesis